MKFTKLNYCQYLLSSQINYTMTNKASHLDNISHDKINYYLKNEKLTPRLLWDNCNGNSGCSNTRSNSFTSPSMKTLAASVVVMHKICQRWRRIAINALNLEQSLKRSNRQKSNRAAMDNNYMLTILAACLSHNQVGYLKSLLSIGFEMRLPW